VVVSPIAELFLPAQLKNDGALAPLMPPASRRLNPKLINPPHPGFPFIQDVYDPDTNTLSAISMVPTALALSSALANARHSSPLAARSIGVGSPADLGRSIGDLLQSNTRLIIADRVHEPEAWERGDSYCAPSSSLPPSLLLGIVLLRVVLLSP
jgi:hypothetical protein